MTAKTQKRWLAGLFTQESTRLAGCSRYFTWDERKHDYTYGEEWLAFVLEQLREDGQARALPVNPTERALAVLKRRGAITYDKKAKTWRVLA